jgi:hypothetical protein
MSPQYSRFGLEGELWLLSSNEPIVRRVKAGYRIEEKGREGEEEKVRGAGE